MAGKKAIVLLSGGLDTAIAGHEIQWEWVRGHSGHPENELADELANRAIDELL